MTFQKTKNISSHLPVSNINHFISCIFFRLIIIQLHIDEFLINSSLNISVLQIASDFYDTLPPNFTIIHRSVSFHRTFGDMTQTRAFLTLLFCQRKRATFAFGAPVS